MSNSEAPPSAVEGIKDRSNYLRGTILECLADPLTGAVSDDDTQLTKFHGIYQQDDRELRNERMRQKLEPYYMFMIRVRVPGGICTPAQWLGMDHISQTHANKTLKLTTRQAFQFHGVLKPKLKSLMQHVDKVNMDCIAACGDVNRNVMANPNPYQSAAHTDMYEDACAISDHLTPQTSAYKEIWMDIKPDPSEGVDGPIEPIYGKHYLPRKFKIAMALPPDNDVDIYANDIGFIGIVEDGKLIGYNVACGGGMGSTHGVKETYPRVATVIGFVPREKLIEVTEQIVCIQRDFGDRTNRKHARFKYTIDDRGIDWLKDELNSRLGWDMEAERSFEFTNNGDPFGWIKGVDGNWHLTLFIEGGRVVDTDDYKMMTGLREIAKIMDEANVGDFRLTGNQNVIVGGITPELKPQVQALIDEYGLSSRLRHSGLRLNGIACVGLNTCALAMAESERYLPILIDKLDPIFEDCGLRDEPLVIRMTGCPNGCGRPFLGEIGFVGKGPGKYNLYLGAGFAGDRLNKLYRENITEAQILDELEPIIRRFADERNEGEHFGDFVIRTGYVKATTNGLDFHD